ncbi:MAG TPA: FMN-binding protein, partial [Clostridia bacterium]
MKNTLKSVAVLTVIAVICAGLLTVANYFWKVEEPQGVTAELLAVFREMVDDDSAEFYELEIGGIGLNEKVKNAYKASAGNNQDIVILNAEGVAGSYGTVEMLTAINTSDDKIISIRVKSNDTDREQGLRDLNAFKDLDNQTLQNTQFDVISNATVTGNAMIDAVKLAMEQYSAKKQEILSAPAKVYDLLSVNIYLSKDIEEIEAGEALDIIIEITSSNIKKANPNKVAVDITMKRDGRGFSSFKSEKAIEGNKVIYTVKLSRTAASSYEVEVKAKIKDTTVTDSLSFEIKSRIELEVISRMFEGVTQVTEI